MGIGQLVSDVKPKNITSIRPGPVGSVGAVNVRTRFRQSNSDMPWAFDPYYAGDRANKLGSNVQDGYVRSYDSGGGQANSSMKNWNGNRSFKHQYGISMHDVQAPDTLTEPKVSWLGDYSWRKRVARNTIVKAGGLFLPRGYTASGPLRGGNYPVATTSGGIEPNSVPTAIPNEGPELDPRGPNPNNPINAGVSRTGVQRVGVRN